MSMSWNALTPFVKQPAPEATKRTLSEVRECMPRLPEDTTPSFEACSCRVSCPADCVEGGWSGRQCEERRARIHSVPHEL
jgi:hypothetical protein